MLVCVTCLLLWLHFMGGICCLHFPSPINISMLGYLVMSFSKSKIKYDAYFLYPKPQNHIFNVQISIVNLCVGTVVFETFKGQTCRYLWHFKGRTCSYSMYF